jgi:hypothetical protein
MTDEEKKDNKELGAADTIIIGLASVYGTEFNVTLHCKIIDGAVKVELKDSYKTDNE